VQGSIDVPVSMSQSVLSSVHVEGTETIADFLMKPTEIAIGVLSTSDVAGTAINSWSFPRTLNLTAKNLAKLSGIMAVRGDIEIHFKVNATRFQQGRYMLRVVYTGGAHQSQSVLKSAAAHVANLQLATSGPHYDIDLATETSLTFTVPYTSIANYSLTGSGSTIVRDYFTLYLIPYDPLAAGSGDTTAQWSLWARYVNVMTTGNIVLQSAGSVELKKANLGPISSVSTKISKTATALGVFPMLAPYTMAVSWMSDVVTGVAKIWGFSKPSVIAPAHDVVRKAVPNGANADGVFTGQKLALMTENEVPVSNGRQRTGVDEMSLDFIVQQPAWISTTPWADNQSSNVLITTYSIGPYAFPLSLYKGGSWPPVSYPATCFSHWRGSVKLRLILPKTEFHSGRLCVAVLPCEAGVPPIAPTTVAETDNLARVIWDIRESNELTIRVPFIQTRNFIEVGQYSAFVYVFVVNELIAPSTVPSTVNILAEVSGCEDFEYANPVSQDINSAYYEPYVFYQSGALALGKTSTPVIVSAESFGESVKSLRSLLKRYSLHFASYATGSFSSVRIDPFATVVTGQITSTAGALVRTNTKSDMLSLFSVCYAFSSGSVRHALSFDTNLNLNVSLVDAVGTGQETVIPATTRYTSPFTPRAIINTVVDGLVHVETPPYQSFGCRSVASRMPQAGTVFSSQPSAAQGGTNQFVAIDFQRTQDNNPITGTFIYRAIGEDFNLSVWNGTFPLVLSTAS